MVLPLLICLIFQVSVLFQTHDDLLQEFTYFLPESQHVAKEAQRKKEVPNRGRGLARGGSSSPLVHLCILSDILALLEEGHPSHSS